MQIKSKTPIEGVSHWCDGKKGDGSDCGQIVKNENARCEAGHSNEIRRSTASSTNKGLQASDAVLSVDELVGSVAGGQEQNQGSGDDMPVVEKYVWCCPECGERGDPMDRYADAQDLGEVHIEQRHGSWTKFLDVKGLTEDGKEISFPTSEQPSAEDSKKMLAALDRRTAARAAKALAEFVRTTDNDEIYAWFIEDLAFQDPRAAAWLFENTTEGLEDEFDEATLQVMNQFTGPRNLQGGIRMWNGAEWTLLDMRDRGEGDAARELATFVRNSDGDEVYDEFIDCLKKVDGSSGWWLVKNVLPAS